MALLEIPARLRARTGAGGRAAFSEERTFSGRHVQRMSGSTARAQTARAQQLMKLRFNR